jgi:hypothetical protein
MKSTAKSDQWQAHEPTLPAAITDPADPVGLARRPKHRLSGLRWPGVRGVTPVASTKVVCDGPGEQRALHVKAATA